MALRQSEYGSVTARTSKVLIVEVQIIEPIEMDSDVTEVQLTINGRALSKMHPERARKLGMVYHTNSSYLD